MVTSKERNLNDISLATWSRLVSATLDKKTSDAFYYDTRKEDNAIKAQTICFQWAILASTCSQQLSPKGRKHRGLEGSRYDKEINT